MTADVLVHIAEGLFRPREALERLLARRPGVADAALMVVAAYALQRALSILIGPLTGAEVAAVGVIEHLASVVLAVAYTFVIGFLMHAIGRAFGGHATREQALVAAGWHALVMTLLWPVLLLGVGEIDLTVGAEISAGTFLVLALYFSVWIWLLARYAATIHGFRSEWSVIAVILGVAMLLSSLILMASGA